jgi:hypothetical protein
MCVMARQFQLIKKKEHAKPDNSFAAFNKLLLRHLNYLVSLKLQHVSAKVDLLLKQQFINSHVIKVHT